MNIVAIVQARCGSTRLPEKIFLELEGKPMLWHVVERLKESTLINKIVIATTIENRDEKVVAFCRNHNVACYRGSEMDVLDRYYQTAHAYKADIVVRITSDCPLIDPHVTDEVITAYVRGAGTHVGASNVVKRMYPRGLDTEVFPFELIKKIWSSVKKSDYREHVTKYIYENPELFKVVSVEPKENWSHLRWTVDEQEDFELVKEIYNRLYKQKKMFYLEDILEVLKSEPYLSKINSSIKQKI